MTNLKEYEDALVCVMEQKMFQTQTQWGPVSKQIWVRVPVPASQIAWDETEDPLFEAVRRLRQDGIDIIINPYMAMGAVLIAEAVNLAAKEISEEYYLLKAKVVDFVATIPGVRSGWDRDGECFFLEADGAGTVCFHDPNNEIRSGGQWGFEWSGVYRQHFAFECLADKPILRKLALRTATKFDNYMRRVQPYLAGPRYLADLP